jgi:hypothetical protein
MIEEIEVETEEFSDELSDEALDREEAGQAQCARCGPLRCGIGR